MFSRFPVVSASQAAPNIPEFSPTLRFFALGFGNRKIIGFPWHVKPASRIHLVMLAMEKSIRCTWQCRLDFLLGTASLLWWYREVEIWEIPKLRPDFRLFRLSESKVLPAVLLMVIMFNQ